MKMPPLPHRDYQTLDAIVTILAMLDGSFVLYALVYVPIPQANLPILAGLAGTILGIVLTYAAFRWQGTSPKTDPKPGTTTVSLEATANNTAAPAAPEAPNDQLT